MQNKTAPAQRVSPLAMSSAEFRTLGNELVERIADFLDSIPQPPRHSR